MRDAVRAGPVLGGRAGRVRHPALRRREEIARLASLGYTPETDPGVILDGPHLEVCFQKVELEPRSKTPVHFDIVSADWLAEIDRLTGLGATVKERFEAHAWMRDPEGNDFCVVDGNHAGSGPQPGLN